MERTLMQIMQEHASFYWMLTSYYYPLRPFVLSDMLDSKHHRCDTFLEHALHPR